MNNNMKKMNIPYLVYNHDKSYMEMYNNILTNKINNAIYKEDYIRDSIIRDYQPYPVFRYTQQELNNYCNIVQNFEYNDVVNDEFVDPERMRTFLKDYYTHTNNIFPVENKYTMGLRHWCSIFQADIVRCIKRCFPYVDIAEHVILRNRINNSIDTTIFVKDCNFLNFSLDNILIFNTENEARTATVWDLFLFDNNLRPYKRVKKVIYDENRICYLEPCNEIL